MCCSSIALAMFPPRRDPPYDGNCAGNSDCKTPGQICHTFRFETSPRPLQLCLTPVKLGGQCGDIHFRACEFPLKCVNQEKQFYGRCGSYAAIGQACNNNVVCSGDGECRNGKCVTKEVGEGGFCTGSGTRCKSGLQCVANSTIKRCVVPQSEGGICGYPFWVCKSGLRCLGRVCRT